MSRANNKYVFPMESSGSEGVTLREYYAGQVLIGLVSLGGHQGPGTNEATANRAVDMADALVDVLSKKDYKNE